jgi:hypothetical protein
MPVPPISSAQRFQSKVAKLMQRHVISGLRWLGDSHKTSWIDVFTTTIAAR